MTPLTGTRRPRIVLAIAVVVLACACLAGFASLAWRPAHDAPLILYPTHLVWVGERTPYKELFDFNFPGTYFLYGFIGEVTRLQPVGLQLLDLGLLIGGGFITASLWPKEMRLEGLTGYGAFACLYFDWYSEFGLQREFFCTLLTAGACLVAINRKSVVWIGVLAGCSCLIKPTTIVVFLWIVAWVCIQEQTWIRRGRLSALWLCGFSMPVVMAIAWLAGIGSLGDFLSIARNYTPLYAGLDGTHRALVGSERMAYDLRQMLLPMGEIKWVGLALIVSLACVWSQLDTAPGLKRTVTLVFGVCLVYFVYPALSGQFWRYHYLPFLAFSISLLAVGLIGIARNNTRWIESLIPAGLTTGLFLYFAFGAKSAVGRRGELPTQRVSDQVGAYLTSQLKPQDTVQPLDWTGGMVGGMLQAHARLATSFIYDFQFYHNVSNPYIMGLRTRFMAELTASRPKFILERLGEEKPWPSGPDTTRDFPELRHFLIDNYLVSSKSPEFNIWIRK